MQFTWSDKEDEELYRHGITLVWMDGSAKAVQRFVEALSYKIGFKCDFAYTAGRAHIDVPKEGYAKAFEAIHDENFMKEFLVPYSEESYDNRTYLVLSSPIVMM